MRSKTFKSTLITSGLAASVLLLASAATFAQQVNLTAGPATATLPDGSAVPMWGYSCGAVVAPATCAATNSKATAATTWSPVVITAPTGTSLTINLTNNLVFGANKIPTSIVIVGLIGGGLGNSATTLPSPTHNGLGVSWPVADTVPPTPGNPTFTPPPQGNRVQSFATEVTPSLQAVADATLRVGSAAETVNVQASPALDTQTTGANQALMPAVGRTRSRFELTTDDGERWTSTDGQSWTRK